MKRKKNNCITDNFRLNLSTKCCTCYLAPHTLANPPKFINFKIKPATANEGFYYFCGKITKG